MHKGIEKVLKRIKNNEIPSKPNEIKTLLKYILEKKKFIKKSVDSKIK
jgi:hypothetical protein